MAKRKSTIGDDPLDTLIPPAETPPPRRKREQKRKWKKREHFPQKERLTVHVSKAVAEQARDAVYHTPGLTLAALAEQALTDAVRKLERQRGQPFPTRSGALKAGRPVKTQD